jgi:hypothetical protein
MLGGICSNVRYWSYMVLWHWNKAEIKSPELTYLVTCEYKHREEGGRETKREGGRKEGRKEKRTDGRREGRMDGGREGRKEGRKE